MGPEERAVCEGVLEASGKPYFGCQIRLWQDRQVCFKSFLDGCAKMLIQLCSVSYDKTILVTDFSEGLDTALFA